MKKLFLLISPFLFYCSVSISQNYVWANQIGSFGYEEGRGIATDAAGNVYTTGTFYYTVDFDPGAGTANLISNSASRDIYITKMDPAGNLLWAKAVGGAETDGSTDLALDASGNVYITGGYSSLNADFDPGAGTYNLGTDGSNDFFILKLDANGDFVWARSIGSTITTEVAFGIAVDASENVYTTGYISGTVDFDPGAGTTNGYPTSGNAAFVYKLDNNGDFGWVKILEGASGDQAGYGIAVDPAGNVISTGTFDSDIDMNPNAGGTVVLTASGLGDSYVSKFDGSGAFIWGIQFTGPGYEYGQEVETDALGYIYATGSTDGLTDFDPTGGAYGISTNGMADGYVAKLTPGGNIDWAKLIGGADYDGAGYLAVDSSGVYISGTFNNTTDLDPSPGGTYNATSAGGSQDMYITKLDTAGNFRWARAWGAGGYDYIGDICVSLPDKVYITGAFENTIDMDPNGGTVNFVPSGGSDTYILKLDQCNNTINAGIDQSICIGSSTMLTASGGSSYVWATGPTTATISVSPTVADTFVVTGVVFPGCSFNDSVMVSVNALPAQPSLGPDVDSCTNALTIGVTNDGISSYQWTSVPSILFSANSQEVVIVQSNATVEYRLSITDAVTGCSNADTVLIRLKETPNVALPPNVNTCNFNPVTLSAGPDPNTNYSWTSNPPGFTASTFSISVTPGATIYYYVAATSTVTGCAINDTSSVYSNGSPSLTLIAPFTNYACFGDSVQLANYLTAGGGTPPYFIDWWYGPGHVYGVNPTYTVTSSWTFSVSISDANSCSPGATTSFQLFNTGTNTDLVGHVTTPLPADVDNGLVYAFRYQPGAAGLDTIATAPLDANGEYNFVALDNDDYLIKVIADEIAFPLLVPTYHGDAFQWDSSTVVTHGCTQIDTADIEMIELPVATGPGVVSGYIIEGDSFGVGARFNGYLGPIYPCVPGGPLKGIDVKLGKNPGGGIQARVVTDSTGKYEFTNLPLQGYKIYVDIPNLPMDSTREIILDATNNVSVQNNYYADSASVYVADTVIAPISIYASKNIYENNFSVFPNPAKDRLYMSFDLSKAGDVQVELSNTFGKAMLLENKKDIAAGTFTQGIDIASLKLNAGVYFISILHDGKKYTQRLVVID